jgi:RimJ/RimL family protein N-acetyltransferase
MEKQGFKREAVFKEHYLLGDEWTDQYDYGLLASEWNKHN